MCIKSIVEEIHLSSEDRKKHFQEDNKDNTDVAVKFKNGKVYVSSFFSYDKINVLKNINKKENTFLNGKYFWSKNMILVSECNRESIEKVIEDLFEEGSFYDAFRVLV